MTELHVNPTTGDDIVAKASNDVDTPWKSLRRAIHDATAGVDTVIVDAADADTAVRGMLHIDKNITVRSTAGQELFVSPSFDMSEGGIYERHENEDYFETIPTATGFATVFTQPAAVDSSNQLIGAGCILLEGSVATSGCRKGIIYLDKRPTRLKIIYKSTGSSVLDLQLRGASNDYDLATLSWVPATFRNVIPNSGGVWTEYTTPWIDGADDGGQLTFRATVDDVRIQRVIIEYKSVWVLGTIGDAAGKYYMPYTRPDVNSIWGYSVAAVPSGGAVHRSVPTTHVCSNDAWAADKEMALDLITEYSSASDSLSDTTPGSIYNDTGNQIIYWHPRSGETPDNTRIEMMRSGTGILLESGCTLINPRVFGAQTGFLSDTTDEPEVHNLRESATTLAGIKSVNTGWPHLYNPDSTQAKEASIVKWHGGGFTTGLQGTPTQCGMYVDGLSCTFSGDDTVQPIGAGYFVIDGATSHKPAGSDFEVLCDQPNGGISLKNVTGNGATVDLVSFMDQSTADTEIIMENCAFKSISFMNNSVRTCTIGSAVFCEGANAGYNNGALAIPNIDNNVNFNATMDYKDAENGDYTPKITSDLFEARVDPNDGTWVVGGDSEPFLRDKGDAGGIQSKHSRKSPAYDGGLG